MTVNCNIVTRRWLLESSWALPLIFSFIFLLYNIFDLPSLSLWVDELFTWHTSSQEHLSDVLQLAYFKDFHPPLYPVFMHYWINLFGDSEFSLRLPSLLAMSAALLISLRSLLGTLGAIATIASSFILLLTTKINYFSQEARNYSFAILLMTLILDLALKITISRAARTIDFVLFSSFCAISLYTHYIFFIILPVFFLSFLYACDVSLRKVFLRAYIVYGLVVLFLISPILFHTLRMAGTGNYWVPRPSVSGAIQFASLFFGNNYVVPFFWLCALLFLGSSSRKFLKRESGQEASPKDKFALTCLLTLVLSFLVIFIKSFSGASLFLNRFLAPAFPCFFFLAGCVIAKLLERKPTGRLLVLALFLSYCYQFYVYRFKDYVHLKEPVRVATQEAIRKSSSKNSGNWYLVLSHPGLKYYIPKKFYNRIQLDSERGSGDETLNNIRKATSSFPRTITYIYTNLSKPRYISPINFNAKVTQNSVSALTGYDMIQIVR